MNKAVKTQPITPFSSITLSEPHFIFSSRTCHLPQFRALYFSRPVGARAYRLSLTLFIFLDLGWPQMAALIERSMRRKPLLSGTRRTSGHHGLESELM